MDLIRIAVILLVAALLWFRVWDAFGHLRLVGLAATLPWSSTARASRLPLLAH
jgi:hypothetical protein